MEQSLKQIVLRNCRDPNALSVLHNISFLRPGLVNEAVPIVRLLLVLGADPNVVDNGGQSPLHLLAKELERVEIRDATVRLLLESGAHLDMVTYERKTPADNWMYASNRARLNVVWDDLPKKLKCLSARVIRDHHVPYDRLSVVLISFVDVH